MLKGRLTADFAADLNFESKWIVEVSDTCVSCTRPNGQVESLNWDDLKMVIIETTDKGPYAADMFWYLVGEQTGCVVPLGATGEEVLVKQLQATPGFNNDAFGQATTSTSNRRFIVWQRNDAASEIAEAAHLDHR